MNDEIKEILDNPRILMLSYGNYILLDDYVKLKEYITNLQQENNNLKTSLDESQEVVIDLKKEIERLQENNKAMQIEMTITWKKVDDLQDFINKLQASKDFLDKDDKELQRRIEKAVEYMKKHIEKCNIDGYEGKFDNFDIFTKPQELLNILNGRSDE